MPLVTSTDDRADAEQQPAGEGAEADADVVEDVVAEHLQVGAALAARARARARRVVHALELAHLRRVEHRVHQLGRNCSNTSIETAAGRTAPPTAT
jgi:hypothetical protein